MAPDPQPSAPGLASPFETQPGEPAGAPRTPEQSNAGKAALDEFAGPRLHALDGLRGCLAMVVLIEHVTISGFKSNLLVVPARFAVLGFFAMSAHVLVRSWGAQSFPVFLIRRFVRLWPVFAVCVIGSAISQRVALNPTWLIWSPIIIPVDPPTWSLSVEVRAMLLMPLIVWASRGSVLRTIAMIALSFSLAGLGMWFMICCAFFIGGRLSRYDFRNAFLQTRPVQWLGAISYSLYLSHNEIVSKMSAHFGSAGAVLSVPVALGVGWFVWRFVERPSIAWSRKVKQVVPF